MEISKIVTGALEENCYVLKKDNECLIIDPGSDSKKIKEEVGKAKIVGILVTHSHFDHIGALRDFLDDNRRLKVYKKSNLEDNEEKELGKFSFRVLYTKGHSSDSISFYFKDADSLFTGDFLFKDTVGRTDLPTGNNEEMQKSLLRMKDFPGSTHIYPGHGEDTILEREKGKNFYLQQIS